MAAALLHVAHLGAVLAAVFGLAWLGRRLVRAAGQPGVIGEIAVGLLVSPALLSVVGPRVQRALLPAQVLHVLGMVAGAGLAMYLVGIARELGGRSLRVQGGTVAWLTAGAAVVPMTAGCALAGLLVFTGRSDLLGSAPPAALALFLAVALTVTAVPVLARILDERGLTSTVAGNLALRAAVVIDVVAWLLLAVAIGLAGGGGTGVIRALVVLLLMVVAAGAVRRSLRTAALPARLLWVARLLLAAAAVGATELAQSLHLGAVFGGVIVGLAVPRDAGTPRWAPVVAYVSAAGRYLLPVFFVSAGLSVWAAAGATVVWPAVVAAILLAVAGKAGGAYLGARLGGQPHGGALRLGALLNCRGLTEIAVLQAGYSAGILTGRLYLVLAVMALVTTAMTGPLLSAIDRRDGVPTYLPAFEEAAP